MDLKVCPYIALRVNSKTDLWVCLSISLRVCPNIARRVCYIWSLGYAHTPLSGYAYTVFKVCAHSALRINSNTASGVCPHIALRACPHTALRVYPHIVVIVCPHTAPGMLSFKYHVKHLNFIIYILTSFSVSACFSHPCQHNQECHDNGHSYTCTCPHGYTGQSCEQISKHLYVETLSFNFTLKTGVCALYIACEFRILPFPGETKI